jgi:integrase
VRYRPSLLRAPSEANLRCARTQLAAIKERIAAGTFSFADEFPDFRDLNRLRGGGAPTVCGAVFDAFLSHCEARVTKNDFAPITLATYRRALNRYWRPKIGTLPFLSVRHSTLARIADERPWCKKTYNNSISILRRAFKFGYRDHPDRHNPAAALESARIRKKDRPPADPFSIQEAESLIAALHRDWGDAQGNYDEFRFFTGLRPSEQIALRINDVDPMRGLLKITKARVAGFEKDSTKTGEDRCVELSPRALTVLRRQLALRERLVRQGKIDHDFCFSREPANRSSTFSTRRRAGAGRYNNFRPFGTAGRTAHVTPPSAGT